jgi:hypothetical protein
MPDDAAAVEDAIIAVARAAREATALKEMARKMAAEITERARRFEHRADQLRGLVFSAMDALDKRKIEAGDLTVFMRSGSAEVVITDESVIDAGYWKVERKLDKAAIKAALQSGMHLDGAELANGLPSITIKGT